MPGALHVLGGEGITVVPGDTRVQLEGELRAVSSSGKARRGKNREQMNRQH
jgi:hypothetical protein